MREPIFTAGDDDEDEEVEYLVGRSAGENTGQIEEERGLFIFANLV